MSVESDFSTWWKWTAPICFFGLFFLMAASGMPEDKGPAGWFSLAIICAPFATIPAAVIAVIAKTLWELKPD